MSTGRAYRLVRGRAPVCAVFAATDESRVRHAAAGHPRQSRRRPTAAGPLFVVDTVRGRACGRERRAARALRSTTCRRRRDFATWLRVCRWLARSSRGPRCRGSVSAAPLLDAIERQYVTFVRDLELPGPGAGRRPSSPLRGARCPDHAIEAAARATTACDGCCASQSLTTCGPRPSAPGVTDRATLSRIGSPPGRARPEPRRAPPACLRALPYARPRCEDAPGPSLAISPSRRCSSGRRPMAENRDGLPFALDAGKRLCCWLARPARRGRTSGGAWYVSSVGIAIPVARRMSVDAAVAGPNQPLGAALLGNPARAPLLVVLVGCTAIGRVRSPPPFSRLVSESSREAAPAASVSACRVQRERRPAERP